MAGKNYPPQLDEWGDPIPPDTGGFGTDVREQNFSRSEEDLWEEANAPAYSNHKEGRGRREKKPGRGKALIAIACLLILAGGVTGYSLLSGSRGGGTEPGKDKRLSGEAQTAKPTERITATFTPAPTQTKTPTPTSTQTEAPTPTSKPTENPETKLNGWYGTEYRYYYHQLTDSEKQLFVRCYNAILDQKTSVDLTGFSEEAFSRVLYVLLHDCPELFFFDGHVTIWSLGSSMLTSVDLSYCMNKEERSKREGIIRGIISSLKSQVGTRGEYEREKAVYRYILDHCKYLKNEPHTVRADSVLCDGLAQCEGYAKALSLLLRSLGIADAYVHSEAVDHAWNMVRIQGNWYQCDVTWDDPMATSGSSLESYPKEYLRYLNVPDRLMTKHVPITTEHGFTHPTCSSITDNYIYREGIYISSGESDKKKKVTAQLQDAYDRGQRTIMVMVDDAKAYRDKEKLIEGFTAKHRVRLWPGDETLCFLVECIE